MGFFSKLKSAMGYSETDYDEDDELEGFNPSHRTPYVNPFKKEAPVPDLSDLAPVAPSAQTAVAEQKTAQVAEVEEELPDGVFDGIITIINGNLPEFVRECIDIEKERKAVNIALGAKFREYVLNLRKSLIDEARRQWIDERNTLNQQLSQSNQRAEDALRKATEIKDRLMSEERQRRAIVERSHDLESRIADLEAQHEQEQLQNKGLLNKIKVMQLQVSDSQKDAEEIARLNKLINDQRQQLAVISDLEAKISEYTAENASLKASLEDMQAKAGSDELEQEYNQKMEVANALINELRSVATAKEQEVKSLSEKLRLSGDEVANLQEELNSAREELEIAAEVQEKIEQFEVIKEKKDGEIHELRQQLAALENSSTALDSANAAIAESNKEIETLKTEKSALERKLVDLAEVNRQHDVDLANQIDALHQKLTEKEKTIANGIADMQLAQKTADEATALTNKYKAENMAFDVQVKNLKANIKDRDDEIAELRKMLEEKGLDATTVKVEPHNIAEPEEDVAVVSAIDEIDNIDWLMPSPPSEPEPEPEPIVNERTKPSHDIGDAQMSLF